MDVPPERSFRRDAPATVGKFEEEMPTAQNAGIAASIAFGSPAIWFSSRSVGFASPCHQGFAFIV
jgi:hypothetical protein